MNNATEPNTPEKKPPQQEVPAKTPPNEIPPPSPPEIPDEGERHVAPKSPRARSRLD
jgi:hypothetical protein